jgi:hypothetical protein
VPPASPRCACYDHRVHLSPSSITRDRRSVAALVVVVGVWTSTSCLPSPHGEQPREYVDAGSPEDIVVDTDALAALVSLGDAIAAPRGPTVPDALRPRPPAPIAVADLGPIVVGDDGSTGAFFVDVDARVHGLTLVVVGEDDDVVIPTHAVAPDGRVVIDGAPLPSTTPGYEQIEGLSRGFTGQWASSGRVVAAVGVGAFAIPSSPDVPLMTGRWSLRVGRFAVETDGDGDPVPLPRAGAVHVFVVLRGAPVGDGAVGLAFHYTGAAGLTSTTAPESPPLLAAQSLLAAVFGGAAVDVSDTVHLDLPDGPSAQTVVVDLPRCEGPELDELVRRGEPDRLNVFVIDAIECGNFGPFLLGFATGLPTVPWARSARGGVVVAASLVADDPELFALTVTHELGHLMGLFHSQENDRFGAALYDHIADTADDERAQGNLMFFNVSRIEAAVLTPGQGQVLQAMPMVLP